MTPSFRHITCLFFCLFCFFSIGYSQKIQIDLEKEYQAGLSLLRSGQFEKAINPLYECYREDITNTELAGQIAYCYFMVGNYREARFFYQDILKRDSTNLGAINNLAQLYERESNLHKAREFYLKLIELDTTNSYYYRQNAAIALRMGDLLNAGAYYSRAYQLNPKDITVLDRLANIYNDLNAPVYADTFARRALQLDPENIRALQTFAKIQHEQKNYIEVIESIRSCMEKGDSAIYYQKMLANALLRSDSLHAAVSRLNFIINKKKATEYTYHNLAVAYELLSEPDSAILYYEAAVEAAISTEYSTYCESLAELYEKRKEYKKAIRYFQEAYNHSEESELIFHLARNYELYYKDKQMAIRQYQRYLASNDNKYKDYSSERLRILKELVHQQRN